MSNARGVEFGSNNFNTVEHALDSPKMILNHKPNPTVHHVTKQDIINQTI